MRLFLLLWLLMGGCLNAAPFHWPWSNRTTDQNQTKSFHWPWNTRTKEQNRLNAAMEPKQTSREEQILRPDITKAFNPAAAKFGSGYSAAGKKAGTGEFYFVSKTQAKTFTTHAFSTKEESAANLKYETKAAETKESWFAHRAMTAKTYATRESSDANKNLQGHEVPGAEKKFVARGRKQAELDKNGAAVVPLGGDRDAGPSWSGDLKPMSIQDVRTLLNKN
jgi:hypothetical protein